MEYGILTKEGVSYPWDMLLRYTVDPKKHRVGLVFDGEYYTSRVVLESEQFEELAGALRAKAPAKEVSLG